MFKTHPYIKQCIIRVRRTCVFRNRFFVRSDTILFIYFRLISSPHDIFRVCIILFSYLLSLSFANNYRYFGHCTSLDIFNLFVLILRNFLSIRILRHPLPATLINTRIEVCAISCRFIILL